MYSGVEHTFGEKIFKEEKFSGLCVYAYSSGVLIDYKRKR